MDKFTLHRLIKCLPILSFKFFLRCIQRSCDPGKDLSRGLRSATSLLSIRLKRRRPLHNSAGKLEQLDPEIHDRISSSICRHKYPAPSLKTSHENKDST